MIARLREYFLVGLKSLFAHRSLFVPLFLMVLVPVAFLWSGQRFLEVSQDRAERLEKDRVGIIHDTVAVLLRTNALADGLLTPTLEQLTKDNPDIANHRHQSTVGGFG